MTTWDLFASLINSFRVCTVELQQDLFVIVVLVRIF